MVGGLVRALTRGKHLRDILRDDIANPLGIAVRLALCARCD